MSRFTLSTCAVVGAALVLGCGSLRADSHKDGVKQAVAVVRPADGFHIQGVVRFVQLDDGVKIVADISGLRPGKKHGFHVHQYGDKTKSDASSAGGHYNPEGTKHGRPTAKQRHAGDLGNLHANANGFAHYERVDKHLSLTGKHPILGRAVVVHAKADEFVQPTGSAGSEAAFGVIGRSSAKTVAVGLDEYKIKMPKKLPAGLTAFVVTNQGDEDHNFEVERGDWETEFEANLKPGETGVLFATLKKGDYEIYCPVGDHRGKGMELELSVSGG